MISVPVVKVGADIATQASFLSAGSKRLMLISTSARPAPNVSRLIPVCKSMFRTGLRQLTMGRLA